MRWSAPPTSAESEGWMLRVCFEVVGSPASLWKRLREHDGPFPLRVVALRLEGPRPCSVLGGIR